MKNEVFLSTSQIIMFFQIGGFSSDLDTIQKDLEFLKRGFNGLFDLIPNTSGATVQCHRGQFYTVSSM